MTGGISSAAEVSSANSDWTLELGPLGACAYILGTAVPFGGDIPLIVLALSGGIAAFVTRRSTVPANISPLLLPVIVFLSAAGLSILISEDRGRSMGLSAPLIPGVLLFLLIANHFRGPRHARLLYLSFSALAVILAFEVIVNAWKRDWIVPPGWQSWIGEIRNPLLVVPNDTTVLAIIAPLSVVLLCSHPRYAVKIFSALSILLSICAMCVIQSRIAMVTMIGSVTLVATFMRMRLALVSGLAVIAVVPLVDGFLGFPLLSKFDLPGDVGSGGLWDARIPIWSAAWAAFLEAPVIGQGLHTFDYTSSDFINLSWVHNLYLETLAEQGVIGLAVLGLLLFCGLSTARSLQQAEFPETRILGVGALAALISFCFAALFELSFLRQWVVIVFFSLLGVVSHLASYPERQEREV